MGSSSLGHDAVDFLHELEQRLQAVLILETGELLADVQKIVFELQFMLSDPLVQLFGNPASYPAIWLSGYVAIWLPGYLAI